MTENRPESGNMNKKTESPHSHYKNMADEAVTLQIFDIIESNPRTSQQKITTQTGLAAGLVHSFMKKVMAKGWIRAKKVNTKRWLYFLTPEGFMEKSRITMSYLSRTLKTYRMAQNLVQQQLDICLRNNWRKLVIAGDNDLAEIASLNIQAADDFELCGIVADKRHGDTVGGMQIYPLERVSEIDFDMVIICDSNLKQWFVSSIEIMNDRYTMLLDLLTGNNNSRGKTA